jgi:hypothetical protein
MFGSRNCRFPFCPFWGKLKCYMLRKYNTHFEENIKNLLAKDNSDREDSYVEELDLLERHMQRMMESRSMDIGLR